MRTSPPPASPQSLNLQTRTSGLSATLMCGLLLMSTTVFGAAKYVDSDTLAREKGRFPGAMALLHDKIARPAPAVLKARVEAMGKVLRGKPKDLVALEKLALAQGRLGKIAAAVQIMKRALLAAPKRTSTHAHLGALHLYNGELDAAISHLSTAMQSAQNAKYTHVAGQLALAKYWKSKCAKRAQMPPMPVAHDMYTPEGDGMDPLMNQMLDDYAAVLKAPIQAAPPWMATPPQPIGFAAWLVKHDVKLLQSGAAARALMLMLYTGAPRATRILEAFADVLRYDAKPKSGSTQLAAAAYLKASLTAKDSDTKTAYAAKAARSLAGIRGATLQAHLKRLTAGLKRGQALQAKIAKDAAKTIARKGDPELRFAQSWYDSGSKLVSVLLTFAVPACEDSAWGNLRKRSKVPRAEMLKAAPRAQWHGYSLAGLVDMHGVPQCHFRGQWVVPMRGVNAQGPRGVWLKVSGRKGSSVVRLLKAISAK